jgi:flagellar basal body P-ring formation protein FlgA
MKSYLRTFLLFAASLLILTAVSLLPAAQPPLYTGPVAVAGIQSADSNASAGSSTPLTRDHLLTSLARDLTAHFNLEGDLQLELLRPWTPPARVASHWQVEILEFPAVPASSMLLRCRVLADGSAVDQTTFVMRASLWRDAWVTRQPLTPGALFDSAALEARRTDMLREKDVLPAAMGNRSFVFARAVPAGRLLTWRDIARRPLVRKGEVVEVSASEGPLTVTLKGLAMENGAEGDTVVVRNPESRKDFSARVVAENRVQVRF